MLKLPLYKDESLVILNGFVICQKGAFTSNSGSVLEDSGYGVLAYSRVRFFTGLREQTEKGKRA